ncbi:zinc ABC transporter ATP-binding protein [Bacillus sp. AFS018417]|uniref:metal ABC transporter ATP-binding protein n=1 Tax=Bacillus sp. AFS018417 TaxID=2033491 RepID=UPI000BF5E3A7|nr:metal ABC transporter ATP-binding protein [Bacillus sp. AFS018417]PEZ09344.1 zinc ABC transporter ATP-binding protein [Bacillus sp. AFS018417]
MKIISMNQVQFKYGNETILEDISLDINSGEFVTLTGPNGAAKSTLLRIMLGLLKPWRGTVNISKKNDQGQKLIIGYVPQQVSSFNVGFPSTVLELVQSGRFPRGKWFRSLSKEDHEHVKQALLGVDMWKFRNSKIGELSGGQKQRICIARVLASEPDILVLDEPTTGMDFESRNHFYQLMRHHVTEHGRTVIMVTHDLDDVKPYADRNIYLERKENTQWRCFTLGSCSEHFGQVD